MRGLILICALALSVVACSALPTEQPKTGPDIVIGQPLSLTGSTSKEGALTKQGDEIWLDWVNAAGGINVGGVRHRVKIVYEDDQSKPDLSAQITERLVTDRKVDFLLAPYGSSAGAADAPVADRLRVPMVAANVTAHGIYLKGYRYFFGTAAPADQYLLGVLDLAAAQNPKPTTVAILSADDNFSVEVAKSVADYAPRKGMTVTFFQQYPSGSTNLYNQVLQAKAKHPDIVLNSGHLLEAIAMNKAAKDVRLDAKVFAYSTGPATPDFVKTLGKEADYVFTGTQWTPDAMYRPDFFMNGHQYTELYRKRYGVADGPAYQTAMATAAALALQRGLEKAGSLDRDRVRGALATLDITTFVGRIKFDEHGLNTYKPMLVEQIQNGQHVTVWPPERGTAVAMYPTPTWAVRTGTPDPPASPGPKLPATGTRPRR